MLKIEYTSYLHFKIKLKSWKKNFLLIISNRVRWHYLAVKKLSALSREITSKRDSGFYCLYCLHLFKTKDKLQLHKKVCENRYFCNFLTFLVVSSSGDSKILEFNQYWKSNKILSIIYACLKSLIKIRWM